MKIISWNCNGGFKKKFDDLIKIDADIYLVQEVGSKKDWLNSDNFPRNNYIFDAKISDQYNDKKGVLAFSFSKIKLQRKEEFRDLQMRYYQYLKFDQYRVLNIWTHGKYIEDLVSLTILNEKELFKDDKLIMLGDFNSNAKWDDKHSFRSHSDFNRLLKKYQYNSVYHMVEQEEFGKETQETFRMYRKLEKPYHIDYAYIEENKRFFIQINHELDNLSDHSVLELMIE